MSILWNVGDAAKVTEKYVKVIKTGTENCGNGVYKLKAGTPLNSSLVVANTANAKYIVAEDLYMYSNTPNQVRAAKVIESGYVDLAKAQAAWGGTYTDAAKGALATAGITLVDGQLPSGGSVSGALIVHPAWGGPDGATLILDKTWQEMFDADEVVILDKYDKNGIKAKNYYLVAYVGDGEGGTFIVATYLGGEDGLTQVIFSTDSADGYPSATME